MQEYTEKANKQVEEKFWSVAGKIFVITNKIY